MPSVFNVAAFAYAVHSPFSAINMPLAHAYIIVLNSFCRDYALLYIEVIKCPCLSAVVDEEGEF